jgi:magnesium-transporting ATPase (P-type)
VKIYQKTETEIFRELGSKRSGLTFQEAAKRLKIDGPNQISVNGTPLWKKIIAPFASIMIGILALAGAISFWQNEIVDAVIIIVIIGILVTISAVGYTGVQKNARDKALQSDIAAVVSAETNYSIHNNGMPKAWFSV